MRGIGTGATNSRVGLELIPFRLNQNGVLVLCFHFDAFRSREPAHFARNALVMKKDGRSELDGDEKNHDDKHDKHDDPG